MDHEDRDDLIGKALGLVLADCESKLVEALDRHESNERLIGEVSEAVNQLLSAISYVYLHDKDTVAS